MTKRELLELIKNILQEYTGTGASGGNSTDGNDIPSPRPFADDEDELENYTNKNVYGAEGGHYRKDADPFNYNRLKMPMFEQQNPRVAQLQAKIQQRTQQNQADQFEIQDIGIEDAISAAGKANAAQQPSIDQAEIARAEASKKLNDTRKKISTLKVELDNLMKRETTQDIIDLRKNVIKQKNELEATVDNLRDDLKSKGKAVDDLLKSRAKAAGDQAKNISQMKKAAAQAKRDAQKAKRDQVQEQSYGSATLTTQGQYKSRFTKTGRPPGIMENSELADLRARLAQLYREMEQEAEPEGGPIADQYADEIDKLEKEIAALKGNSKQDKSYDEVYLKGKLVGMTDAYEYEVVRGEGRITIYPDLGSLQYKSRSTQEIVFSRGEGGIQFIRAFGYERSYDELKKVLPELPEMGDSSYAGFMNVMDSKPILVDLNTAVEMKEAMIRGRDAESKAQSDFYGSRAQTGRIGYGLEEMLQSYYNNRSSNSLMIYMDKYKKQALHEGTVKKFFKMFENGKTNEEVLRHYAGKGVSVPEQYLNKVRKQYENLKKAKLEIEFSEQEAKDFKSFKKERHEKPKQMSSRLFKEAKTIKKYPIPPEIKQILEKDLEMFPLPRFVSGLKAVNSIPPSYRVFLLNDNYFDIIYEDYSMAIKIGPRKYYLGDLEEKHRAKKTISSLLTQPILKKGEEETPEDTTPTPTSPPEEPEA